MTAFATPELWKLIYSNSIIRIKKRGVTQKRKKA
jgi:hypothetical protein